MFIRDAFTRLTLDLAEVDATGVASGSTCLPDLRLKVRLRSAPQASRLLAFSVTTDGIWLSGSDCAAFLHTLADLDRTRRGSAEISGQTPEAFRLRVAAADSAGHIIVEGHVGGSFLGPPLNHVQTTVGYGIEVDPTVLPRLVADISTLLTLPNPSSARPPTASGVA